MLSTITDVTDISARTRKCHSCQQASQQHKQLSTRTEHAHQPHSNNSSSSTHRRSSEQHHRTSTSSQGLVSPPYQSSRGRSGSTPTPNIHLYMSLTESPANHHDYMIQLPVSERENGEVGDGQSYNDNYMKLSDTTSPDVFKVAGDDDTLKNESSVGGGRVASPTSDDSHEYQATTPSPDPDKEHFYVPVPKSLNSSGNSNAESDPIYDRLPTRHQSGDGGRNRIQSSESEEMDSLYDKVPVPCPVLGGDSDQSWMFGSPPLLSPELMFNSR